MDIHNLVEWLTIFVVDSCKYYLKEGKTMSNVTPEQRSRAHSIRDAIDHVLPAIADTPATVNEAVDLIKPWVPGTSEKPITYTKDLDLRVHDGAPYKCAQTHTHRGEAGWEPGVAPALWYAYHGTSPETARPYIQPTGAHDVYRLGEYIIDDGRIKPPTVDNMAYSPAAYPAGWRIAEGE